MSVVFGARLILPSAAKFVADMFVDPLLKFSEPVPLTVVIVPKKTAVEIHNRSVVGAVYV